MDHGDNDNIPTYLNDHLAGSVAALELIDDLSAATSDESLKQLLADLKRDIESDQKVLERLIARADEKQSVVRKAAAWVSEKAARAKFKIAGDGVGGLGLVQALEMLLLGIRGKELLWRNLAISNWPGLQDIDLVNLEQRAIEQQERVQARHLEAAKAAFGSKALCRVSRPFIE